MVCIVSVLQKLFHEAQLMEDEVHVSVSAMKLIKYIAQKSFIEHIPSSAVSESKTMWMATPTTGSFSLDGNKRM